MKRLILIALLFASPAFAEDIRGVGETSVLIDVFFRDTATSTRVVGKTGYAVGGTVPTCYYQRSDQSSATAITFVAGTDGTWTSSGFVARDGTNLPGVYQIGVPNAAISAGQSTTIVCTEGTNIDQTNIKLVISPTVNIGSMAQAVLNQLFRKGLN
jgi:hypothetical protein